jgi:nicotinic acid mononucleotide adenylyltransferase
MDPAAPPGAAILVGRARLQRSARVGVFSGSFNPLTLAHVALTDAARAQAQLDAIVWLLAVHTVDKERVERAAQHDRLAQMVAFARGRGDAVAVTNRGLYVEEARALQPVLAPGALLVMLVGFDKIVQILDPRYYADRDAALRELLAEASLIVAPRAGARRAELADLLAQPANRPFASSVGYLEMAPEHADESSTLARQLAQDNNWEELRALLPPEGVALARETGAYAPEGTAATRYALRERWLRALGRLSARTRRGLPSLTVLLRLTAMPNAHGAALRAWLERVEQGTEANPPPP